MSENFSLSSIVAGLLVHAIYGAILVVIAALRKTLDRTSPIARKSVVVLVAIVTIAGNLVLRYETGALFPIFSSILLVIAFLVLFWQLRQFWDVGLIGADRTIKEGLDYTRSLKMCKNSLSFLGIGARKLTEHVAEFQEAMSRCNRPDRPIRLLLCKPDSPILKTAAQNAGKASDEYVRRVQESLRAVAECRTRRKWNIEVRFYDMPYPVFRLMFIDDWLCLASHYVLGEGDGSEWPQLHVRRSALERDVNSLYHPFERYFNELWQKAEIWDFNKYIEGR